MALSQEFWLQRRRREAQGAPGAGRAAATVYQTGPRAPVATSFTPPASSVRPPPAMNAGWPGPPGPQFNPATAGVAAAPPDIAGMYAAAGVQNPFMAGPGQFPLQPPAAAATPPGIGAVGCMPPPGMSAWLAPRRPPPTVVEPLAPDNRDHKEWNSDDEEIDEFGRKKAKKKSGGACGSTAPAGPKSARLASQAKVDEAPAVHEAAEPAKKGKAKLSEKQQAALERLHRRSRPAEKEAEAETGAPSQVADAPLAAVAACDASVGQTLSAMDAHAIDPAVYMMIMAATAGIGGVVVPPPHAVSTGLLGTSAEEASGLAEAPHTADRDRSRSPRLQEG